MQITQNYAERSTATVSPDSFGLSLATETSRPPVNLDATIRDGLAYARLMLTLYNVVTNDGRSAQRDHTAYQEWVRQQYMNELDAQLLARQLDLKTLVPRRDELKAQLKEMSKKVGKLVNQSEDIYWKKKREYFNYLYSKDFDAWIVLDPVVSVHPDALIFEAFSKDESSYGRVTVPTSGLEQRGNVNYGTTNIDFSPDLAREIGRIRSYRPTSLKVGGGAVALSTDAGAVIEKKIDLPPTWVRGFLQVQSAGTLPATDVRLSAFTLAEVLAELGRKREDKGPRSLRFRLQPGKKPVIVIEPWNIEITEPVFAFEGKQPAEIRIWGRRRLLVLADLLPYASEVRVRLLGTGMPTYWSVFQNDTRFDLGLSGWTQNDWSRAAQFDLLASTGQASEAELKKISETLTRQLYATPQEISSQLDINRETVTTALQQLCREGRAMYDHINGNYRWRQLFPFMPEPEAVTEDPRLNAARKIIQKNGVKWALPPQKNAPPPGAKTAGPSVRMFEFKDPKSSKFWEITLDLEELSHTVRYGRIGTDGQAQTKDFDSKAEVQASYEKLVREKTGKGYKEVSATPASGTTTSEAATDAPSGRTRFKATVKSEKTFDVTLDLDLDGRVVYAECTCGTFRRDKLRKGPCPHILATVVAANQYQNESELKVQEVAGVR
jgi:predicted DNA-binding WGR domain protein